MPRSAKGGTAEAVPPASSDRPALSREFVVGHKRRRIVEALAELTAEQGYERTKVSDIVRRAAIARKTLYDNFSGKEEVFLTGFDAWVEEMTARVERRCATAEGWRERIEAGLAAFLGYVAEDPALAHMCVVEAMSATPATTVRYEATLQSFVEMARRSLPSDDRLPETIAETLVGGVVWIVHQRLRRGEADRAEELVPELLEFMSAPYLGLGVAEGAGG